MIDKCSTGASDRRRCAANEIYIEAESALQELDDVLIRDVGNKIRNDGRSPLVIDTSGQTSVFLRYMDTNYVNALSPSQMEPEKLRKSILGGIRYGKPFVLDLMDVDLWSELVPMFDKIIPCLFNHLLTKSLLQGEKYMELVKPGDGEEYDRNKFQDTTIHRFIFVVLTSLRNPNADMIEKMYTLRIEIQGH